MSLGEEPNLAPQEQDDIEIIKRKQQRSKAAHKAWITRTHNRIKPIILKEKSKEDIITLNTAIDCIKNHLNTIQKIDEEILENLLEDELDEFITESGDYEAEVQYIISQLKQHVVQEETMKQFPQPPEIRIRPFNGEPSEFSTFWDIYKSTIHDNQVIPDVQKFGHLKGLCEGKAYEAIRNIRHVSSEYRTLVDTLHRRFNKEDEIKDFHLNCLLNLQKLRVIHKFLNYMMTYK